MLPELFLLLGEGMLVVSVIMMLVSYLKNSIVEQLWISAGLVMLLFHISVEHLILAVIPPSPSYIFVTNFLIRSAVSMMLFGFLTLLLAFQSLAGEKLNLSRIMLSLSVAFSAGVAFASMDSSIQNNAWVISVRPVWYVYFIAPPVFAMALIHLYLALQVISQRKRFSPLFMAGWFFVLTSLLLISYARIRVMDSPLFQVLYPVGIFLITLSIVLNPQVMIVHSIEPWYLVLMRRESGVVIFKHVFQSDQDSPAVSPALKASLDVLADLTGQDAAPRTVNYLDFVVSIVESENYISFLFSKRTNFSVIPRMTNFLACVERTVDPNSLEVTEELSSRLSREARDFNDF